ncbi:hypothetical protein S83_063220, partial [Arachis hypogaea]
YNLRSHIGGRGKGERELLLYQRVSKSGHYAIAYEIERSTYSINVSPPPAVPDEDFKRSLNTVNSACDESSTTFGLKHSCGIIWDAGQGRDVSEGTEHAPLTVEALVNKHAQFLNSMSKLQVLAKLVTSFY